VTYIKPPASHECTWRSGPPPEVGWWPASALRRPSYLRYWNGTFWSWGADNEESRISEQNSAKRAKRLASDDPVERAKAAGTMGPLSGVTENHRLKKNSKIG